MLDFSLLDVEHLFCRSWMCGNEEISCERSYPQDLQSVAAAAISIIEPVVVVVASAAIIAVKLLR